jgi:putative Holliday junction resolvase
MRVGRRAAIDVGKARVGVAVSDPHGILASPVATVARTELDDTVRAVIEALVEYEPIEAYVGLPVNLSGASTESTKDAIAFALALEASAQFEVRLIDERMTTNTANAALRASGRNAKNSRSVVDQAAAIVILEHALTTERNLGKQPGKATSELEADA